MKSAVEGGGERGRGREGERSEVGGRAVKAREEGRVGRRTGGRVGRKEWVE